MALEIEFDGEWIRVAFMNRAAVDAFLQEARRRGVVVNDAAQRVERADARAGAAPPLTATIVVSLLFGFLLGWVPALRHSRAARTKGLDGRRYWVGYLATSAVAAVTSVLILTSVLHSNAGSSASFVDAGPTTVASEAAAASVATPDSAPISTSSGDDANEVPDAVRPASPPPTADSLQDALRPVGAGTATSEAGDKLRFDVTVADPVLATDLGRAFIDACSSDMAIAHASWERSVATHVRVTASVTSSMAADVILSFGEVGVTRREDMDDERLWDIFFVGDYSDGPACHKPAIDVEWKNAAVGQENDFDFYIIQPNVISPKRPEVDDSQATVLELEAPHFVIAGTASETVMDPAETVHDCGGSATMVMQNPAWVHDIC